MGARLPDEAADLMRPAPEGLPVAGFAALWWPRADEDDASLMNSVRR